MKKDLTIKEIIIIASMLFGMFFGAGNLIFPIHMGQLVGFNVYKATIGFIITAVGFPLLGVCALCISKTNDMYELSSKVGKPYNIIFTVILYLTIGPFFAIPRCATTSFTVGFLPIISDEIKTINILNVSINKESLFLFIFSFIFFVIVLFFSLKPNKIIDYIGKYINPIFLFFFIIFLIVALTHPTIEVIDVLPEKGYEKGSFFKGLFEGYNTMDAIASLAFGITVINVIKKLGIEDTNNAAKNTIKAGIICAILMSIIYFLTALVGVVTRGQISVSENGGIALAEISRFYFDNIGMILLFLIVTLACLKTSIGLIVSCSQMFERLFPNFIKEKTWTYILVIFSFIISNIGLTQIIQYSLPVLMFIYPLVISLIIISIVGKSFEYHSIVYKITTIVCIIMAFFDFINYLPENIKEYLNLNILIVFAKNHIPFYEQGLGWIIPTIIAFLIAYAINYYFIEDEHTETY